MEHQEWQEKVSAFLDGKLPSIERASVELHAKGCVECGALLRNWHALSKTFFAPYADMESEEFVQKVMVRIPERSHGIVWGGWKRWAMAAAAAGMLALAFPFEAMRSMPSTERLLLAGSDDASTSRWLLSSDESSNPDELLGLSW